MHRKVQDCLKYIFPSCTEVGVESLKKKSPKVLVSGDLSVLYPDEVSEAEATQHFPRLAFEGDL